MSLENEKNLIEVQNLFVYYPFRSVFGSLNRLFLKAVDGVNLYIRKGETVGLVGESGCGKTTFGLASIRLIEPTAGKILFRNMNILELSRRKLRKLRQKMQIIFQNPYGSLNPRMKVEKILSEGLEIHKLFHSKKEMRKRVYELMEMVGLEPHQLKYYPHEFSGGERQRICIARALSLEPEFIVADEPLSALDVSIQAQIANLMKELQEKMSISYLFISHDLKMVKFLSHVTAVMYLGKIVEIAESGDLFLQPMHPYTRALMEAIPMPDPQTPSPWERISAIGDLPSPFNPPEGCRFKTRCSFSFDKCSAQEPQLIEIKKGHKVACHLVTE